MGERRHGVVDEEVSEHRVAEGPADERCHHRVSQGRVPLSQTESAKDSGHYPAESARRQKLLSSSFRRASCCNAVKTALNPNLNEEVKFANISPLTSAGRSIFSTTTGITRHWP